MKKAVRLILLLLMVFSLVFPACAENDEEYETVQEENITETETEYEENPEQLNNVTEEDPDEQEVEYEIILPDISDQDNLEEDPVYRDGYIEDEETDGEPEDTKIFSE